MLAKCPREFPSRVIDCDPVIAKLEESVLLMMDEERSILSTREVEPKFLFEVAIIMFWTLRILLLSFAVRLLEELHFVSPVPEADIRSFGVRCEVPIKFIRIVTDVPPEEGKFVLTLELGLGDTGE